MESTRGRIMASKNKLLGSGLPEKVEEVVETIVPSDVKHTVPCFMYSKNCPEGKVFKIQADLDALGPEWKDHPGKVRLLPGHEKLFEGEEEDDPLDMSVFDETESNT
jgi:hypothetical protein